MSTSSVIRGFIDRFEYEVLRPHGLRYRPKQRETIYNAIATLESGKWTNVLIDSPVGAGKTLVNYAIAKYFWEKYGINRIGCMLCTGYLNWKEQMRRINPTLYRKVMHMMGETVLDDYIEVL